jgi:hypothetical protein
MFFKEIVVAQNLANHSSVLQMSLHAQLALDYVDVIMVMVMVATVALLFALECAALLAMLQHATGNYNNVPEQGMILISDFSKILKKDCYWSCHLPTGIITGIITRSITKIDAGIIQNIVAAWIANQIIIIETIIIIVGTRVVGTTAHFYIYERLIKSIIK